MAELTALPARLDDQALALVEQVASAPLPALPEIDDKFVAVCLRSLSILPRKADDDLTGELRNKLYRRKLRHLSRPQLSFTVETALDECEWFPTPAQLSEIAKRWQRTDEAVQARNRAETLARKERNTRLDENRRQLQRERCEQDWIDALPDRHCEVFEVEGLLWRCECGSYAQRSQWRDVMPTATKDPLADVAERFPSQRDKEAA